MPKKPSISKGFQEHMGIYPKLRWSNKFWVASLTFQYTGGLEPLHCLLDLTFQLYEMDKCRPKIIISEEIGHRRLCHPLAH